MKFHEMMFIVVMIWHARAADSMEAEGMLKIAFWVWIIAMGWNLFTAYG